LPKWQQQQQRSSMPPARGVPASCRSFFSRPTVPFSPISLRQQQPLLPRCRRPPSPLFTLCSPCRVICRTTSPTSRPPCPRPSSSSPVQPPPHHHPADKRRDLLRRNARGGSARRRREPSDVCMRMRSRAHGPSAHRQGGTSVRERQVLCSATRALQQRLRL
jgi:hypothetical protein